ncbi:DNA cytosine methyltransferase [Sphingomonas sp. SUN019]|uniref:DNA cytosine methyltransferase n=1 Tax=Sphingomonas sp. SUN019 TaxID=2937788 RepID=UPI00216417F6|nr:DNA cytosine methyltransferase [Sphingomonas sp. SUN019]UVO49158.1 DNA cytosine methyltransferase [Sphingomonas sp. SUN019]
MGRYSVVSIFSGAMGLDAGLGETGRFKLLAAVEKERSFCDTIRANRDAGLIDPDVLVVEDDIRYVDPQALMASLGIKPGELDVLVGGPPCQSFSTAGRRGTTDDPRGALLWEFLRFVDAMKPRFFLMENVRGLISAALRHRPIAERPEKGGPPLGEDEAAGSVIRLFADDLRRIDGDYHMDCFEVNAVNYGAPQLRERALFIGNRFNAEVDFPNPTHASPDECRPGRSDLFTTAPTLKPWATLGDAIGRLNDPGEVIMDFSARKKSFLEKVPPGSNWRSLPVEDQKLSMGKAWLAKGGRSGWWRRLSYDLPCPTLVTMPNHASTSLCHPDEVRALTLREYAAIQEFPAGWRFCGSPTQQYAQVGNAVPVRLGKVAGLVIADALDSLAERSFQSYPTPPSHFRTVYIQSHVRTRQWFKGGETFVWKDGGENGRQKYRPPVTVRHQKKLAAR